MTAQAEHLLEGLSIVSLHEVNEPLKYLMARLQTRDPPGGTAGTWWCLAAICQPPWVPSSPQRVPI